MAEHHPRPELTDVEHLLRQLKPAPGGLDRDRVLFRAGRASARGPGRLAWPGLAGALAVATVALSVALATRPGPVERVVYVEVPRPAAPNEAERPGPADEPPAPALSSDRVFTSGGRTAMERQLLRWGLDALPEPAPSAAGMPGRPGLGVPVEPGPSWLNLFTFEGKGP